MRRIAFLLAGLLAAGCQVDTEGAACAVPGATDQCPSGQACGNDHRCSSRAAACAATRCDLAATRCADGDVARVVECRDTVDPVCGTWEPLESCAPGLVCADAACLCPAVTDRAWHWDAGRTPYPGVAPTGVATPAACRLGAMEEALARAVEGGPGSRAVAAAAGSERVLDAPLEIPAGITLTTTSPADPAAHTLAFAALDGAAAVVLGPGATLEGFTVRNDGATAEAAIAVACDGATVPAIRHVKVLAAADGAAFATGITVGAGCGVEVDSVEVSGASTAGLFVDSGAGAPATEVEGSIFAESGTGAIVRSGAVAIASSSFERNVGRGLWAKRRIGDDPLPPIDLAIETTTFTANGDTGLKLEDLPDGSTVVLTRLEVHGNHATTPDSSHASGRRAGGVVLWGPEPASFSLKGSRIYGNDQDQLGMYAAVPWNIAGTASSPADPCATPNVFACPAAGFKLVYSSSGAIEADATNNVWDVDPPTGDVVSVRYDPTCAVPSLLPACARVPGVSP